MLAISTGWQRFESCCPEQFRAPIFPENRIGKTMGRQISRMATLVDWFPLLRPVVTSAMSIWAWVTGEAPIVEFAPGEYGAVLRLTNKRDDTIIIKRIDAAPVLLAFAPGRKLRDLTKAQLRARPDKVVDALAILRPAETIEVEVITLNAFTSRPAEQKIKVTLQWCASSRSTSSRRTTSKTITVKDVTDSVAESRRRRACPS
jgi:hypothetical protein